MKAYEKFKNIRNINSSILCVGLDTDINKFPARFSKGIDSIIDFNKAIIDATKDLVCAYKMNFAFYEQYGAQGMDILEETFEYIPDDIFTIADAKRADIGNTSAAYAKSVFDVFNADSITVNPYMGSDSIEPFFENKDKYVFVLALTSNPGSTDYQRLIANGKPIYRCVIEKASHDYAPDQLGFVVGATHPEEITEIREYCQDNMFLIPGVGAQGGDIEAVIKSNGNSPAMINVSRGVIYPSGEGDFLDLVREKALFYRNEFKKYI